MYGKKHVREISVTLFLTGKSRSPNTEHLRNNSRTQIFQILRQFSGTNFSEK